MICIRHIFFVHTHDKASAFLFQLYKLSWIDNIQTNRQCHPSIIVSAMCIPLFLPFYLNHMELHHRTKKLIE